MRIAKTEVTVFLEPDIKNDIPSHPTILCPEREGLHKCVNTRRQGFTGERPP